MLLPEYSVQCTIFTEHIVDGCHCRYQTDLGEKAGDAKCQHPSADAPMQDIIAGSRLDNFHIHQIPHCKDRCEHLPDDCCNSCTHHAPLKAEDENRVKDDVDNSTGKRRDHGKLGVAVGADDGVHGLSEHIERNTQRNIEEVFLRVVKGFFIDCAAEHSNNAVRKNEIYRH